MDPRLFKVSWTGNVPSLQSLLEADPFILYDVVLTSSNTPLHIACMPGHLNFVKEILKLRPEFVGELNQDGTSPLHIAAANGHVEIVKELLHLNQNLSLIVGKEGTIPLHNAVVKGRVDVVAQLLQASVDSIELATARGETALHLAVRNNQFAAFKLLLEHAKQFNKEGVLTKKDNQGNTILHLAVSKKQYEVVELLLNGKTISSDKTPINELNERGLTPLDVLQLFHSDAGDREIEEILKRAGALKASNLNSDFPDSSVVDVPGFTSDEQPVTTTQPTHSVGRLNALSMIADGNFALDIRNILLIVAILITTVTYQAMISLPGGLVQEGAHAGKSVIAVKNAGFYVVFLFCNSAGFFISTYLIYFLSANFPFRIELFIGIFAMIGTYDACMYQTAPTARLRRVATILMIVLSIVPGTMIILRKLKR